MAGGGLGCEGENQMHTRRAKPFLGGPVPMFKGACEKTGPRWSGVPQYENGELHVFKMVVTTHEPQIRALQNKFHHDHGRSMCISIQPLYPKGTM